MAAEISSVGGLSVVRRDTLFADRYLGSTQSLNYGVLPRGQGFVMIDPDESVPGSHLFGVANWTSVLQQPVAR